MIGAGPEGLAAAAHLLERGLEPLVLEAGDGPASGYPTGAEWIERYLAPLAGALGSWVRYGARVTGVSRKGRDRLVDAGRDGQPAIRGRNIPISFLTIH